jgi:hypothetical protein
MPALSLSSSGCQTARPISWTFRHSSSRSHTCGLAQCFNSSCCSTTARCTRLEVAKDGQGGQGREVATGQRLHEYLRGAVVQDSGHDEARIYAGPQPPEVLRCAMGHRSRCWGPRLLGGMRPAGEALRGSTLPCVTMQRNDSMRHDVSSHDKSRRVHSCHVVA